MNLKKFGKRLLYFVGGIMLTLVSLIILGVYRQDGGPWLSQSTIYIYLGIIFGVGLFITSFQKNIDGNNAQKAPEKKPDDAANGKAPEQH